MRKRFFTLIVVGVMLFATACGNASSSGSDSAVGNTSFMAKDAGFESAALTDSASYDYDNYDYEDYSEESVATEGSEDYEVDLEGYDTSRKLIYNTYISLESKKFDEDVAAVKELVKANGGYFESSSTYGNKEYGNRSAGFTARIPADKYDAFMGSVGDVGAVTSKNESIEDITSDYVDVQARIKSLNTKLERLQELEANAENVTELLEIEDRINEVQYQIESYTAQMKTYDDQVDYSTVNIDITEVATYTEIKADSAWNRFVEAFGDSFAGFVEFLQGLVIAIIYMLPYLIIIAIVLIIVIRIRKKKGKGRLFKKKDKKADKTE